MGPRSQTIPRCVKVQHIKGRANILADSVSGAVGLYHDLDFKDSQQELRTPFEPLPPVEPSTHTPIEVYEIVIKPDIENLTHNYDTQNTLPATMPIQTVPRKCFTCRYSALGTKINVPTRINTKENNQTTRE